MKYKCTEVTRNKIKRAFLELTNVKPANKIFVKEIIQAAGISRACFYVHYENIAALIHEIGNDTVKSIMEITEEKKYTADMSREIACNRAFKRMAYPCEKTSFIAFGKGSYSN